MNQILAKRYAFCDFSSIVGFPNQVPSRDEWENSLPRFHGEEWEVPAEHLLDFHEFIDRLEIVHEDVKIKLFKFSLEGIGLDWCRSLPDASINSLAEFHSAFHVFCKDNFSADLLFPDCCHEFNLSKLELQEEYAAEENTFHHDQEINGSHYDNLSDAFDIISSTSTVVNRHDDQILISENSEDVERTDRFISDNLRSAVDVEDSLPFPDLQKKTECSRHLQEGQQKDSDQQSVLYVLQADLEQPASNSMISKDSFQHLFNLQLEQQFKEVFLSDIYDPVDNYFQSMSSKCVKTFLSDEGQFFFCYQLYFCVIWLPSFFGLRSRTVSANHFLTWLHWKHAFT
jgi:hypothetical protein